MPMTDAILGYIESIELPDLGICCDAKVDTGACTSSLHADRIELFNRDGESWVRFHVLFSSPEASLDKMCEAKVLDKRTIASSNGQRSKRYIIQTTITIRDHTWQAEVSLSHRGTMRYPMLLGRKAISGRFLVDVSKHYSDFSE
ncbi:MAG: ATP-dependent zinc protease [Thalassolituus sp.]|nr:MAG: ATP-dependent zinc protease [Thalassolituus sp.]